MPHTNAALKHCNHDQLPTSLSSAIGSKLGGNGSLATDGVAARLRNDLRLNLVWPVPVIFTPNREKLQSVPMEKLPLLVHGYALTDQRGVENVGVEHRLLFDSCTGCSDCRVGVIRAKTSLCGMGSQVHPKCEVQIAHYLEDRCSRLAADACAD
jgi:hypothetical protein